MITTENVATYDYIVVGAGSAGAHDENVPEVLRSTCRMELPESGYDWDYPIEAQGNGNVRHAHGPPRLPHRGQRLLSDPQCHTRPFARHRAPAHA